MHRRRRAAPYSIADYVPIRRRVRVMASNSLHIKSSKNTKGSSEDEECAICYQPFTLKATLPDCGHCFCFLCIKGVALRHGACPLCRQKISSDAFRDPILDQSSSSQESSSSQHTVKEEQSSTTDGEILKTEKSEEENPTPTESEANARWYYQARRGGWWRYEERQERDIEEAFQQGVPQIDLLITGFTYCIDFASNCQYRKDMHGSNRWERALKRVAGQESDGDVRGIAGVRKPSEDLATRELSTDLSLINLDD